MTMNSIQSTDHVPRSFWSLFVVQFQGAFSDNLFKFLVLFLVNRMVADSDRDSYISLVLAAFSLPFLLFAMTGGYFADRFHKRSVVIGTKVLEVVVMALGAWGLWMQSLPMLFGVVFLVLFLDYFLVSYYKYIKFYISKRIHGMSLFWGLRKLYTVSFGL